MKLKVCQCSRQYVARQLKKINKSKLDLYTQNYLTIAIKVRKIT